MTAYDRPSDEGDEIHEIQVMESRVMRAFSRSSCSAIRTRHLFPLGFADLRAAPPSPQVAHGPPHTHVWL